MHLRLRSVVFAAVLAFVALPASAVGEDRMALISGSFRIALQTAADATDDARTDATIEKAQTDLSAEYSKYSKGLKKAGKAVGKLDKLLADDGDYQTAADAFLGLLSASIVADSNRAGAAIIDDIFRNPLGPATRASKKLAKFATKLNATLGSDKPRKKKIAAILKSQKLNESVIRKYE